MQIQVRAKSGLHAGATWLVKSSYVVMGASPRADVFLCDVDTPDVLLSLRRFGRRYEVETLHPDAKSLTADQKVGETSLFAGQSLTLDFRHIQLELNVQSSAAGFGQSMADTYSRFAYAVLQLLRSIGAKAIVALLFLASLMVTTYILFFGSVGTVKAEAISTFAARSLPKPVPDVPMVKIEAELMNNIVSDITSFAESVNISDLHVKVEGTEINLKTEVSRQQMQAFEKKLIKLALDYGQDVDIRAEAKLTSEQQVIDGIDVEQLILGQQPVAILRDGERLFEGGTYRGIQVVKINSEGVVLKGAATYEVVL